MFRFEIGQAVFVRHVALRESGRVVGQRMVGRGPDSLVIEPYYRVHLFGNPHLFFFPERMLEAQ